MRFQALCLHTQQVVIVGFGVPSNKPVFSSGGEVSAGPGVNGLEFGHGHLLGELASCSCCLGIQGAWCLFLLHSNADLLSVTPSVCFLLSSSVK